VQHWRGFRSLGSIARCLALFAILIQFTLPLGTAIAAGLSDGHSDVRIVFQCLGGAPQTDPAAQPVVPWHTCAMPGGCCVAPVLATPPIALRSLQDAVYRVSWHPVDQGVIAAYRAHRPPVRAPPLKT